MTTKELIKLKKQQHRKIFWTVVGFGIIAFVYGIITPPPGKIDWSVIAAVSVMMLFSIVYIVIDSNMAMKLSVDIDDRKVEATINEKGEHSDD